MKTRERLSRSSAATASARVTMAASRAAWVRMSTPRHPNPSRPRLDRLPAPSRPFASPCPLAHLLAVPARWRCPAPAGPFTGAGARAPAPGQACAEAGRLLSEGKAADAPSRRWATPGGPRRGSSGPSPRRRPATAPQRSRPRPGWRPGSRRSRAGSRRCADAASPASAATTRRPAPSPRSRSPRSPAATPWCGRARSLAAAGKTREALAALAPLLEPAGPADPARPDPAASALVLAGQLRAAAEPPDPAGARADFLRCWSEHVIAPEAPACLAALARLPGEAGAEPDAEVAVRRAEGLVERNRNADAIALLAPLVQAGPAPARRPSRSPAGPTPRWDGRCSAIARTRGRPSCCGRWPSGASTRPSGPGRSTSWPPRSRPRAPATRRSPSTSASPGSSRRARWPTTRWWPRPSCWRATGATARRGGRSPRWCGATPTGTSATRPASGWPGWRGARVTRAGPSPRS